MSSFKEFSSTANHGDMNSMDTSKKASDVAKNRIDPETGAVRSEQDDYQENRKPNSSNRDRSQDRNTR
jgi:hypothetical protein